MRICSRCKKTKPESEFNPSKPRTCAECWRKTQAAYYRRLRDRPKEIPATKVCSSCEIEKPSSEFGRHSARPDGLRLACKVCIKSVNRLCLYGLTKEAFQKLLDSQDGNCAICTNPLGGKCHVDHDHACCPDVKTCGSCVRGLLCRSCNQGIGNFKDDPDRLRRAIEYLGA